MKKLIFSALILGIFIGCGDSDKKSAKVVRRSSGTTITEKTATQSYSFKENGCETGVKKFTDENQENALNQMCMALQDDEFNNNCAESLRKQKFACDCEGRTWKDETLEMSCASKNKKNKEDQNKTMSYSFNDTESNCRTGRHEFSGAKKADVLAEFCEALKDSELNNNCAEAKRADLYKAKCQDLADSQN